VIWVKIIIIIIWEKKMIEMNLMTKIVRLFGM